MNFFEKSAVFLLLVLAAFSPAHAEEEKKITITVNDQMKYDITAFEVAAGQKVVLTLADTGKLPAKAMSHNFVLLKPGTDVEAFARAAVKHMDDGWIPTEMEDKILVRTKLCGPGESDTITFTAPVAGTYDYLCTFAGHSFSGMRGVMTVK